MGFILAAAILLLAAQMGAQELEYENVQKIEIPDWNLEQGLYQAPVPTAVGTFEIARGIDDLVESIGTEPNQVRTDLHSWYSDEQRGLVSVPLVAAFVDEDGFVTELGFQLKQMPAQAQWQPQFAAGLGLGDQEDAFVEAGLIRQGEYELADDPRDPGRLKIYAAGHYHLIFSDTRLQGEKGDWRLIHIRIQF